MKATYRDVLNVPDKDWARQVIDDLLADGTIITPYKFDAGVPVFADWDNVDPRDGRLWTMDWRARYSEILPPPPPLPTSYPTSPDQVGLLKPSILSPYDGPYTVSSDTLIENAIFSRPLSLTNGAEVLIRNSRHDG